MNAEPLLAAVWAKPGQQPTLGYRDWESLLGQARQSRLIARLASHHVDHGWLSDVPAGPRPHLEAGLRLADRQQHEVRWEVNCIARAAPPGYPSRAAQGCSVPDGQLTSCARTAFF